MAVRTDKIKKTPIGAATSVPAYGPVRTVTGQPGSIVTETLPPSLPPVQPHNLPVGSQPVRPTVNTTVYFATPEHLERLKKIAGSRKGLSVSSIIGELVDGFWKAYDKLPEGPKPGTVKVEAQVHI